MSEKMKKLDGCKYVNGDDVVLFIKDGKTVPTGASGWMSCDIWLDPKLTLENLMNRRVSDHIVLYEHERYTTFTFLPGPPFEAEDYKCKGKGAYLFLKNWEAFLRFLEQGK